MFQDALFVPERQFRARAAALPLAALIHAVALTLLVTVPLLRVGDLPQVDISDIIVIPAPPATPLAPPKARGGNPAGRLRARRAPVAAAVAAWKTVPVDIPDGISEEGLGDPGADFGIPGGVDYGSEGALPHNLVGDVLYQLIGEPAEPVVRAVGDIRPPRLIRRVEPDYPAIAREARVEGIVILEATTDVYGRVTSVRVLRSIPLLDEAALEAVRQWAYEPMVINGRPRPVTFTVTVNFVLK